jgi:hypothetical protein
MQHTQADRGGEFPHVHGPVVSGRWQGLDFRLMREASYDIWRVMA